jgi:hypothetical protein
MKYFDKQHVFFFHEKMIADLVHDPKEQIQYLRNQAIGEKNILH